MLDFPLQAQPPPSLLPLPWPPSIPYRSHKRKKQCPATGSIRGSPTACPAPPLTPSPSTAIDLAPACSLPALFVTVSTRHTHLLPVERQQALHALLVLGHGSAQPRQLGCSRLGSGAVGSCLRNSSSKAGRAHWGSSLGANTVIFLQQRAHGWLASQPRLPHSQLDAHS